MARIDTQVTAIAEDADELTVVTDYLSNNLPESHLWTVTPDVENLRVVATNVTEGVVLG